jgi:hypothetical protein
MTGPDGYHPGRPPWSAPKGRDLLAGVAVLFVLLAVLVVMNRDGGTIEPPPGSALALPRAASAAATSAALPEWTDVPVATSVVELGPNLSQAVADGLVAARARIERCVVVERRRAPAAAREDGAGPIELVLRLAPRSGAVHVVGVEPQSTDGSAVLADCARRHLDGDAFPAPAAAAGRRHRLLVTLP